MNRGKVMFTLAGIVAVAIYSAVSYITKYGIKHIIESFK